LGRENKQKISCLKSTHLSGPPPKGEGIVFSAFRETKKGKGFTLSPSWILLRQ